MAGTSGGSRNNRVLKKEAKAALDQFKFEIANEIGVNLKEGYNGDLTTKEAGSVGGYMVKKMIAQQEEQMASGNLPRAQVFANPGTTFNNNQQL